MAMVQRSRLEEEYPVDRISRLPNEILDIILSSLSLKEAIATSVLSSRWRYSWIFSPKLNLDIDWLETLPKLSFYGNYDMYMLQCMYVRWVDRLLIHILPKSSTDCLVKFRLSFYLSSSFKLWIDDWLNYAVRRKVETLDLVLIASLEKPYSFPYKEGNFPDNLKLLKKLSLHSVDVSSEVVAYILENCRLLKQLSLSEIDKLSSLQVVRTSTKFKCLEISQCRSLALVVVLESEVACIKYSGAGNPHCVFMLGHVPLLTELWIQAAPRLDSFKDIKKILDMFGLLLPQLHKLKIYATSRISYGDTIGKIMPNLKELVVVLGCDYCEKCSILPWLSVAPALLLHRFVIEASHQETSKKCSNLCNCNWPDGWIGDVWLWERDDRICRAFPHVEEVEFVGYRGVFNHLQIITQFVKYDGALEKIIIDPRSFKLSSCMPWDLISRNHMEDEISARNHAKDQFKDSTIIVNIL